MCASQGRLHYLDQQTREKASATETIKYDSGTYDNGWWGAEKMAGKTQKAIRIFETSYPGDIAVFAFDNSSGHACRAKDALVANRMRLGQVGAILLRAMQYSVNLLFDSGWYMKREIQIGLLAVRYGSSISSSN